MGLPQKHFVGSPATSRPLTLDDTVLPRYIDYHASTKLPAETPSATEPSRREGADIFTR